MNPSEPIRPSSGRLALTAGLIALAVVAVASLWFVLQAAWADASSLSARTTVADWRDGYGPAFTPERWERTRVELQSALDITPGNAQLHDDLGFLHAARSQSMGKAAVGSADYQVQQTLMEGAITHYRAATVLRPTFPYSWTYLALAKHLRDQHDAEFWSAFDLAMRYGQNETALHSAMVEIAYAMWPQLGPQRQQAVGTMVATANKASRERLQEMATHAGIKLPG